MTKVEILKEIYGNLGGVDDVSALDTIAEILAKISDAIEAGGSGGDESGGVTVIETEITSDVVNRTLNVTNAAEIFDALDDMLENPAHALKYSLSVVYTSGSYENNLFLAQAAVGPVLDDNSMPVPAAQFNNVIIIGGGSGWTIAEVRKVEGSNIYTIEFADELTRSDLKPDGSIEISAS